MYEQIIKAIEENRLGEALEQVKKLPNDKWEKFNFLGLILLYQQNFSASKDAFERALEKEPMNDNLLFNYAQTLLALGEETEAWRYLMRIHEKDWAVYDILGDIEYKNRSKASAIKFYKSAYEQNHSLEIKEKLNKKIKAIKQNKKIGFFCSSLIERETESFREYFQNIWEVKIIQEKNFKLISETINWADLLFFENISDLTNFALNNHSLVCQKNVFLELSYEDLFSNYVQNLKWEYIDYILVENDRLKELFFELIPFPQNSVKFVCLKNGIDLEELHFSIHSKGYEIVYDANLSTFHNLFSIAELIIRLNTKTKKYRVHFINYAPDPKTDFEFKYQLKELGIEKYFTFQPDQELSKDFLRDKNYFICDNSSNTNKNNLYSAMACGVKPIIRSDYSSRALFPEKWLYKTYSEIDNLIFTEKFDSGEYRRFIEKFVLIEDRNAQLESIINKSSKNTLFKDKKKVFDDKELEQAKKTNYQDVEKCFKLANSLKNEERFLEALILMRRCLWENYYIIDREPIKAFINEIKSKINEKNCCNIAYKVSRVDKLLFITFDYEENICNIASILNKYAINVDIAFTGKNPRNMFTDKNPFRKIIGITDIEDFIEYVSNYEYEGIYMFSIPERIGSYFKNKLGAETVNLSKTCEKEKIIDYFTQKKIHFVNNSKFRENYTEEDLTVLLTTYNRPENFQKVVNSLNNFKHLRPHILVLDSSNKQVKEKNQKIVSKNNFNGNFKYLSFPSEIDPRHKVLYALRNINCEFFIMSPDDDYFAEEGLINSLEVLNEKKDIFSVKGKSFYFGGSTNNLYEYDWFLSLNSTNYIARLLTYTKKFCSVLVWQIYRRKPYLKLLEFLEKNKDLICDNFAFEEYTNYFLFIMTGKIIKINRDLNIRNKGIGRQFKVKNFDDAVKEDTFNRNFQNMKSMLRNYAAFLKLNFSDQAFEEVFVSFLINFLRVSKEYIEIQNGSFNMQKLESGMKKSWVWK